MKTPAVKSHSSTQRTRVAAWEAGRHSSAGPNAVALAPPACGIDFVDGARANTPVQRVPQHASNQTGIPDRLKTGMEALSGIDLSDVRVHTHSAKPAQLDALAYAQGSEIHLSPGADRHLPHEVWHVVQQRQGRVKPTLHARGAPINDDLALEREADVMGARALAPGAPGSALIDDSSRGLDHTAPPVAQRLAFSAALAHSNIAAPRTFTESSGEAQLALTGAQADLVEAGGVTESANIAKALNQAGDRFAEIGTKVNAIKAATNMAIAAWNGGATPAAVESFIYRIRVPYKAGKKTNKIELDYQVAPAFYGYVVRQKDTGDAEASTMAAGGPAHAETAGQVNTFNAAHANTGPQALGGSLLQDATKTRETNEARIDARTKLAGEGSRFLLVRNNYTTIADDSRIWTQHKGNVHYVTFRTLWLNWGSVFNLAFDIPDSEVADKLVKGPGWNVAPGVVKRNRWAAKGIDIEVHA